MKQLRNNVIRAGLEVLYFSGAHHLLRPIFAGVGAIFMLHHVRPGRDAAFQPNRHLEVTPEFLRAALKSAQGSAAPIELVVEDAEFFQTYSIPYHEGEKIPHLELVSGQPDLLTKLLQPLTK